MINEFDIADLKPSDEAIELWKVERNSIVSLEEEPEVKFKFAHVDGMYSLCFTKTGEVFHPAAWSKVFVWKKDVEHALDAMAKNARELGLGYE